MSIKPRAITVLSNELHVLFAPDARGVASLLHGVFDGSLFGETRIYFAAGYHGEQLNAIGRQLEEMQSLIAVSGDDCVACQPSPLRRSTNRANWVYKEGDFSTFDQSQREACLRGHAVWLKQCGVATFLIDLMIAICGMPYAAKGKRLRIIGAVGAQLATGIDWTTVINSMSNLCYWLEVFLEEIDDPVTVARKMGLTIKYKETFDVHQVTFLKGWWQYDQEEKLCWYPLPSQVLKIGKTLREPRLFSRSRKDAKEGIKNLSYAIASSFPNIPEEYPILGPFIASLRRLGKENASVVSASEDGWYKPQVESVSVNRTSAMVSICTRYGLSVVDVERVEHTIGNIKALPAFISDPVFLALRDVDYM